MRLAKAGYFNGDPGAVLAGQVDIVLDALEYERFVSEFQAVFDKINEPPKP